MSSSPKPEEAVRCRCGRRPEVCGSDNEARGDSGMEQGDEGNLPVTGAARKDVQGMMGCGNTGQSKNRYVDDAPRGTRKGVNVRPTEARNPVSDNLIPKTPNRHTRRRTIRSGYQGPPPVSEGFLG